MAAARRTLEAGDTATAYLAARSAQRAYRRLISRGVVHARRTAQRDARFGAYRRLVDLLVKKGCLEAKLARRLGHWPSYNVHKIMRQGFDAEEPLATTYYTLPKFYGAFADQALLKELVEAARKGIRNKLGAEREGASAAALAVLKEGDFAAAAGRMEAFFE